MLLTNMGISSKCASVEISTLEFAAPECSAWARGVVGRLNSRSYTSALVLLSDLEMCEHISDEV